MIQREMEQPAADPISRLPAIEAILFALQSIIRDLPTQDYDVSSQLLAFIATVPESSSELKRTTIRLIGKLPHWSHLSISTHIPYHISGLVATLGNPKLCMCSAQAIMNICAACDDIKLVPFTDIATSFNSLRQSKALPSEPESYLIEGLCRLIARAPAADQPHYLPMILTPIESTLQNDLASQRSGQEVLSDVAAMTSLFRFLNVDKSLKPQLVQYFSKIQPLLDAAIKGFPSDKMSEEVCRCFKYAMRTCGSDFGPLIPSMAAYLVQSFREHPYAAFIYAAQECMATNKVAQLDGSAILPMIGALSDAFFTKMTPFDKFVNFPDLVEEYFFFLSKSFEDYSVPMIHSPLMPSIVDAAVNGLQLQHREAQKGILTFLEKFFSKFIKSKDPVALNLIENCAGRIIHALVLMMSGSVQWFAVDYCARYILHSLRDWPKFEVRHYN